MRFCVISTGGTIASSPGDEGLTPTMRGEQLLSHIPDLLDGHRSRSRRSRRDGDVACAESLSARQRRFRGAARVVELGEDSRPAGVYGIDKDFQPRDVDIR